MRRIIHKKKAYKIAALTLIASTMLGEVMPIAAFAAKAQAEVDETMYLNLDYYGSISKANVVKSINFNSQDSYTDHCAEFPDVINMMLL